MNRRNFLLGASVLVAGAVAKAKLAPLRIEPGAYIMSEWESDLLAKGWLVPRGQLLIRSDYERLFAVLGAQYGSNGPLTFRLPDMREHCGRGVAIAMADGSKPLMPAGYVSYVLKKDA